MSQQLIREFENKSHKLKKMPELKSGYTVRVHQRVKEGAKERVQIFEGLVMKVGSGSGVGKTFTVRKIVSGVGVEKTFPFHTPTLVKLEIVRKSKVRRARLFYMRELSGKGTKLYQLTGSAG
ncbi:MAG: 50S ribosomal protein L19, partial [Patescibacteria group bacterium]